LWQASAKGEEFPYNCSCDYFDIENEGPKNQVGPREEIRELYGTICYRCGEIKDITIDHVKPENATSTIGQLRGRPNGVDRGLRNKRTA